MVRRLTFIAALVAAVFLSVAAVADGPVTSTIEARKVVTSTDGSETFILADQAAPKDIIEYRLTYANGGEDAVRNITITDPIPAGTVYLPQSASVPQSAAVQFSVDQGKSFHAWPVLIKKQMKDGTEAWVEATPDMITHIRWSVSGDFEPEGEISFSYRASIK